MIEDIKTIIKDCTSLEESVVEIFRYYNKHIILEHTLGMRDLAVRLAKMWGFDIEIVNTAALLHDISGIISNKNRVLFALNNGIPVLEEEDNYPLIIHQKISEFFAREIFGIEDELILSAIRCHTTLKENPSYIDKIIFIADKLEWDRDQKPKYYDDVYNALVYKSLDAGLEKYLEFVYKHRSEYAVIHPWLNDAFDYFNISYEEKDYISYLRSMIGHRKVILVGSAVIILNDKNQVLLQKRSESAIGKWGLPGGLMELGESTEETAKREVLEETGLEVDNLEFVAMKSGSNSYIKLPNKDEFYVVSICYKTNTYIGEPNICDHESLELRFVDTDNLPENIVGRHREFIEILKRETSR